MTSTFDCFVYESIFKTTNRNLITTKINQTVHGTYNFALLATESKIAGNTVTRYVDIHTELANSSGSYFMDVQGNLMLESDESAILQGNLVVNENVFEPTGQYLVNWNRNPQCPKWEIN